MKTKEDIYDEKISPLMKQIIEICQENKIAMIASYSIPGVNDEDPNDPLQCTTGLLEDGYEPPQQMREAMKVLRESRTPAQTSMNMVVSHADGSKEFIAFI